MMASTMPRPKVNRFVTDSWLVTIPAPTTKRAPSTAARRRSGVRDERMATARPTRNRFWGRTSRAAYRKMMGRVGRSWLSRLPGMYPTA